MLMFLICLNAFWMSNTLKLVDMDSEMKIRRLDPFDELGLEMPQPSDGKAMIGYVNTLTRFIAIKEEQAQKTKDELLILWTDFFKPAHLEAHPNLHDTFWKAAKLCSACKVEVNLEHAQELLATCKTVHEMFWKIKGRDVAWYTAS